MVQKTEVTIHPNTAGNVIVPVVHGPAKYNPPTDEFKPFVPPEMVQQRQRIDGVLERANASAGLRKTAYELIDRIAANPQDMEARRELAEMQSVVGHIADSNDARAAHPVPLTGHDRRVAEAVLSEHETYNPGRDVEEIGVLRGALSVGGTAIAAADIPQQSVAEPPLASTAEHAVLAEQQYHGSHRDPMPK